MILIYFRLFRPLAWILFLVPFSLGFARGATSECNFLHAFFAIISFCCEFSFCFIINALADKDVDKLHDGKLKDINIALNPLATGQISDNRAISLGALFLFFALLFAWQVNPIFFLFFCFITILGYSYSMQPTRFKARPVADILSNSFSAALLYFAGITICGQHPFSLKQSFGPLWEFTVIVLYASFFYIPSVVADFVYDKKACLRTSAVFFGPKKLLLTMYPICIVLIVNVLLCIFILNLSLYFYLPIIIIIIFTAIISNIGFKRDRLLIHGKWLIITFLLISVALIIYGILKILNYQL